MRKKITFLSACAAFLLAGTMNIWGENPDSLLFRPPYSTTNNNAGKPFVNNEFGAGESAIIESGTDGKHGNQKVANPWTIKGVTNPYSSITPSTAAPVWGSGGYLSIDTIAAYDKTNYNTAIGANLFTAITLPNPRPADLQVGSEFGRNTVIRTYSGDGFAMGWISLLVNNTYNGNSTVPYGGNSYQVYNYRDYIADPLLVPDNRNTIVQAVFGSTDYKDVTIVASFLEPHSYKGGGCSGTQYTGLNDDDPYGNTYDTYNSIGTYVFSFNKFNKNNFTDAMWGVGGHNPHYSGSVAPCGLTLFSSQVTPVAGTDSSLIYVWHHDMTSLSMDKRPNVKVGPTRPPYSIYTSTIDSFYAKGYLKDYYSNTDSSAFYFPVDDSVALVQFNGYALTSSFALDSQKPFKSTVSGRTNSANIWGGEKETVLDNYKRPTTVLINGDKHEFNSMKIKDIGWKYESDTVAAASDPLLFFEGCCSGIYAYTKFSVKWNKIYNSGATLLDGAFALAPNSDVYVDGSVKDSTSTAATKVTFGTPTPDASTEAMMVLPDSATGRFTLRVVGNYEQLNMFQDTTDKAKKNIFYKQATFPTAATDVYLYESVASPYKYAATPLAEYNNLGVIQINEGNPRQNGKGGVFGVYGDYINDGANNANVHTAWGDPAVALPNSVTKFDNPGVIEIGKGDGKTGYKYFYVYSGGTLKNFEAMNWVEHRSPVNNFPMTFETDENTPNFRINGDSTMIIANYGSNNTSPTDSCAADINWYADGMSKLFDGATYPYGIGNASDSGAVQIEALGDVHFYDDFSLTTFAMPTELRILSDGAGIQYLKNLTYTNTQDSNLVVWAKGSHPGKRSCIDDTLNCGSGEVLFDGVTAITQNKKGITLLRSENDDVLMNKSLTYNSTHGLENGEVIMQAGQDIYASAPEKTAVTFNQKGQKPILMEAKRTIHVDTIVFNRDSATRGDITLKAGYGNFSTSATVTAWTPISGNYACTLRNIADYYGSRNTCTSVEGADIWMEGPLKLNLAYNYDSINTTLRAFNSIYVDDSIKFVRESSNNDTVSVGRTLLFAETGNIEAIVNEATSVDFTIGAKDSSELRLQAGNQINDICAAPTQLTCWYKGSASGAEFDGNILFNKPLNVNNNGKGYTLLTSARDIENQVNAPFTFTYKNDSVHNLDINAGRHIETHAKWTFNYDSLVNEPTANIWLNAGRLAQNTMMCNDKLCKDVEAGTSLTGTGVGGAYDPLTTNVGKNNFAAGGLGQGSILFFDSVEFNYKGHGEIKMTALNGNIESDPYLHVSPNNTGYTTHQSPITFNHDSAQGKVIMQAIDIKLHDKLDYFASSEDAVRNTVSRDSNGQFYISAYDSILTRKLKYENKYDSGSVFITTAKYKLTDADCAAYNCQTGKGAITQGNIVLGYAADCDNLNTKDSIIFNFNEGSAGTYGPNVNKAGANLYIKAGYEGYTKNKFTGTINTNALFTGDFENDKGKGFGGNITFDFMKVNMAKGNGTAGGYTEISTPNGNIWGKDSLQYHGIDGNLLVDAGVGSLDDTLRQVLWTGIAGNCSTKNILNTNVPYSCDAYSMWRTGNIMMKGGSLNFNDVNDNDGIEAGTGNAIFRTREGFIDTYDKFTVDSMRGDLLKYAGVSDASKSPANEWGDISERDFEYHQIENSGSVFYGADDNIMMNYGYSNGNEPAYMYSASFPDMYDVTTTSGASLSQQLNPYYGTSYMPASTLGLCYSTFNVNENGYLWYKTVNRENNGNTWTPRKYHRLYRGCTAPIAAQTSTCSPLTGECQTIDNGARDLMFNFDTIAGSTFTSVKSGGLGIVAGDYIDMFTKFTFYGGQGSGMGAVPGMTTLNGESVQGYGLYMKSKWTGNNPEKRRVTCFGCGNTDSECKNNSLDREWTYIGFHDDARIHAQENNVWVEAPVVEFFGHAELDAYSQATGLTGVPGAGKMTLKGDSLIFHDSAIFCGQDLELLPFTTTGRNMYHGVVNDKDNDGDGRYYRGSGPAISMADRMQPVLEFGYQRCNEPSLGAQASPNRLSDDDKENVPMVGGDVIVAFKRDFALPIQNTVVVNHARISFISDSIDNEDKGEYIDACIRTDLLRIRNKVEFYTDPNDINRRGTLKMNSSQQLPSAHEPGVFAKHIHMEPGSELSIPSEDSLSIEPTTTIGGYGNVHENVFVKQEGIIAPGFASMMASDCQSGCGQGLMEVHNLEMEPNAIMRISIGRENCQYNPETGTNDLNCTQTDTLHVRDTIFFSGKVPLRVVTNDEFVDQGCYLFLIYDDTIGTSKERVKNLILEELQNKATGYYYSLDFSEVGRVYLCVSAAPVPPVQRYVMLHTIEGVTTTPTGNLYHYVSGHQDFSFTATYADGTPRVVTATGYYSQKQVTLPGTMQPDGSYQYIIQQVTEPWDVYFGDYDTANEGLFGVRVWAHKNTLFFNVDKADVASIYTMTGVLYRKIELPEGSSKLTLDKGIYVVTLKDGSVHKIVIK